MKLIYKLIPLLMVNLAWANDLIPDYVGDNYVHFAGTATIKSNAPVGTKIISSIEGKMSTRVHGSCNRYNVRIPVKASDYNTYVNTYDGIKVYATGTPGIGYSITDFSNNSADRERWTFFGMVSNNTNYVTGEMSAYVGVSFYKTGDIQPDATISHFNLAKFYLLCIDRWQSRLMATLKFTGPLTMKVEQDNNSGSNNGGWNNGGQGGNGNNGGSNNGGWNNGGQGGNGNNGGSNNGGWNNGGQGNNGNNGGSNNGSWNNGGQGSNGNNGGSNNGGWNNGGQGSNGNNGGSNNGGQGGNGNNGGSNNGGQGSNGNNTGSNNGGQKDNIPNNNNNNNNSNSNNSNIWPTH
ncbi:hypothetical protein [Arsenophonus apicola]|uniref:Uncharacterized protein n=1 Tax=Arsenophonus apicola TaxID=2879119 RepID=A0ABY8P2F1_9GAMM|nr:hypothetical protein [Arsenophonus apicola]WGO82985.1 hypothetical protein QG404_11615 [Arsenophonus apicola]